MSEPEVAGAEPPQFGVGQEVRVRTMDRPGHVRTPRYVRGAQGVVTAVHGRFRDPESLGHGGDGLPERWLYQVEFAASDMWDAPPSPSDIVCVDIFEQWLDAAPPGSRLEMAGHHEQRGR